MILPVVAGGAGVGKLTRALDEVQPVIIAPRLDIVLADEVQRAYQLHAGEIRAVQLRHHALYLRAVQHTHEYGLDNVVIMVPKRNFIAAKLLREAVQVAAAHPRAEVARRFLDVVNGLEYVRLEYRDRYAQRAGVILDYAAVVGIVARIHHEVLDLEIDLAVPLQLLKKLRHQHRVLAAGDAHRDAVALVDKLIGLERLYKLAHQRHAEFLAYALLDPLAQLLVVAAAHLRAQPRDVAALKAVRLKSAVTQLVREVYAHDAAGAVDYQLFPVARRGRQQFLRAYADGTGNKAVGAVALAADVAYNAVLRLKLAELFNRYLHVRPPPDASFALGLFLVYQHPRY